MKNVITSLILVFFFSTCGFAQLKIGVIDAQKIVQNSNRGKEIQKRLENRQKNLTAELEAIQNKIKTIGKELENPTLNNQTREDKTREFENLQIDLKRRYDDAQAEMRKETNSEMQAFERQIMPLVNNYGQMHGFTIIFDVSSSGITFFDTTIDVTTEIIAYLDSQ